MAIVLFVASVAPASAAAAPTEGRVYEQVTPVEKGGGLVESDAANALPDGSGVRYFVRGVPAEAEANPLKPRFVSLRGADGWSNWLSVDPPLGIAPNTIFSQTTLAVSDDGEHSFVVSNRNLAPGGVDGTEVANLYMRDLRSGAMTWVGTATDPGALSSFVNESSTDKYVAGARDLSWAVFYCDNPLIPGAGSGALYRWSADSGLEVVSVLPGEGVPTAPAQRIPSYALAPRQVSADGRRIAFGLKEGGIYLWEDGATQPVSVSKLDGTVKPAELIGTDVGGRFVFGVSAEQLVPNVNPHGGAIYRFDLETGDLAFVGSEYLPAPTGFGFLSVLAVADDGRSLYYAPSDSHGQFAGELIGWRDGGESDVVAEISQGDPFGGRQDLSPNGRYLAFFRESDIYRYDAEAGQLSCASCLAGEPTREAKWPAVLRPFDNFSRRVVDDRGRVFFTSSAALEPEDRNGVDDVYVFANGRAHLVSPGTQAARASLGDIAEDGDDVFFVTAASLVAQDRDGQPDLYDARAGGGFASQNRVDDPPVCAGEGCRPPVPSPPSLPAIGSEPRPPAGKPGKGPRRCRKARRRCARDAKKSHRGRHGRSGGGRRGR